MRKRDHRQAVGLAPGRADIIEFRDEVRVKAGPI
jgi:hypothetical protein